MKIMAREKFIDSEINILITFFQFYPELTDWKSVILFILRKSDPHQ